MEKKYFVKIENGVVVQKQPNEQDGFTEVSADVICGYLYDSVNKTFSPPIIEIDFAAELKNVRDKKLGGGITVGGTEIGTDNLTQSRIMAVSIKAKEDSAYTVKWKLKSGFITLDATTIIIISNAVHDHVQACFTAESNVDLALVADINGLNAEFESEYDIAINS